MANGRSFPVPARYSAILAAMACASLWLMLSPRAHADAAAMTLTPTASAVQLVQLCSSPDAVSRSICVQVLASVGNATRAIADLRDDLTFHCAPKTLSPNETSDLLLRWALENQRLANQHYAVVVLAALRDAYPCAGSAQPD